MRRTIFLFLFVFTSNICSQEIESKIAEPWDFSPIDREVGDTFFIDGIEFQMLEMPFPRYDTEEKYSLRFPVRVNSNPHSDGYYKTDSQQISARWNTSGDVRHDRCNGEIVHCYQIEISGHKALVKQYYRYISNFRRFRADDGSISSTSVTNYHSPSTWIEIAVEPSTLLSIDYMEPHSWEVTEIADLSTMSSEVDVYPPVIMQEERHDILRRQRRLIRYMKIYPAP